MDTNTKAQNQSPFSIFSQYPYALIACTVRNEATLSIFLQRLEQIDAFVQDVTWVVKDQQETTNCNGDGSVGFEEFVTTDIGDHLIYPTHYLNTFSEKDIRNFIRVFYISFNEH